MHFALALIALLLLPGSISASQAAASAAADPAPRQEPGAVAQEPAPSAQQSGDGRVLPLRVEDVVRLVAENAPAIRQAQLAALASTGTVLEAEGLFDPVFFADLTYQYAERPNAGGFLAGGISNTHIRSWDANQGLRATLLTGATVQASLNENYSRDNLPPSFFGTNPESNVALNLSVTQPLLKGGWELNSTFDVRSAEIAVARNEAGVRLASVENLQAAIDAYWDLAFAIADVSVKELSLRLAEELRDMTMAKFRVGTAAEVDVVQTEADIATRTEALLTARNAVRQAEDALRTFLFTLQEQAEWDFELQPSSELPEPAPAPLDWFAAFDVAQQYRSDLRQIRLDVEQARLTWDVAKRNRLPQLDFIATGTSLGLDEQVPEAFRPVFELRSAGYSVGLAVEMPFGNRQFRGAEIRARLQHQLEQRRLRDQENEVAVEVRDAVRNLNYLAERVTVTEKASQVARRQLEAEERRLREGASTNFEVLQFQEDLEQALTAELGARMDYAKAAIRLYTVQGLNWDGSAPELDEEGDESDLPAAAQPEAPEAAGGDDPSDGGEQAGG